MKAICIGALAILLTAGCGDPTAEAAADADLNTSMHQLDNLRTEIKALPALQQDVREARERVAKLEKERDALKKAGHR